ncbi:uncharacterized protein [Palaemon carinicauda]|uniref:uncharacterized protein n=1 Tax=Palaemon carinicauda TaxID=392227 RepID=UPI0035B58F0F
MVPANGPAIPNHDYETLILSFRSSKYIWKFLVPDVTLLALGADFFSNFHILVEVAYRRFVNANSYFSTPLQPALYSLILHNNSPMDAYMYWCATVLSTHLIPKKDGSLHPCGGYSHLQTEPDHYRLPTMADVISYWHKAKVFSILDHLNGYYQMPMNTEEIPKATITILFGTNTFNYSGFGFRNARGTFQHLMDGILRDLPFSVYYMDDILLFSSLKAEQSVIYASCSTACNRKAMLSSTTNVSLAPTKYRS